MGGTSRTDWVVQIGELLQRDDLQTALQTPTSIFKLPECTRSQNPKAYSPSRLFLGPFHELRPELHKMEIFKLQNAKKAKEKFQLPELTQMVDELKELDVQIRACYGANLPIGSEPLAWRILIDGLLLLQLLGISPPDKQEKDDTGNVSLSNRRHFTKHELPVFNEQQLYLNLEGNLTTTQNEIVKDLLKLENQIPIQVQKRVLPTNLVQNLDLLFYKFCVSVSPLSLPPYDNPDFLASHDGLLSNLSEILDQSQHLLHFLYALLFYQRFLTYRSSAEQRSTDLLVELLNMIAKVIRVGFLQQLVEAVGLVQTLLGLLGRVHQSSSFVTDDTSPKFPSASELKKVGVKFHGGDCGEFDEESATLKLPTIAINAFCEVILRNLVAFEMEAKLKPPHFSHYVKLMSGLIGTAKDVRILREAGIIAGGGGGGTSGEEDDVVKLFKDLARNDLSDDDDEVGSSDDFVSSFSKFEVRIMEEIRGYYSSCWAVKAERFAKRNICPVFQGLMILVVLLLILIVVIRTVCGWFSCPKILAHTNINLRYYFL